MFFFILVIPVIPFCRLFAVKRCARCQAGISASELVMRARDLVYHVHCFTCASCGVPLSKGDHFGMREGLVYCRPHYELLYSHEEAAYCELAAAFRGVSDTSPGVGMPGGVFFGGGGGSGGSSPVQKGRPRKRKLSSAVEAADLAVSMRIPAAALGELNTTQRNPFSPTTNSGNYWSNCNSEVKQTIRLVYH